METLPIGALLGLATSALYVYVGVVLGRRPVSPDSRLPNQLFAAWWLILGASGVLGAIQMALYLSGRLEVWVLLTISQVSLALIFAALWALQCYLVYLYRGSKSAFVPLGVFYLVLYTFVLGLLQWLAQHHPYTSISDNGWTVIPEPRFELGRGVGLIAVLILLGPQLAGAFAYFMLFFKTKDRTQRYRIAVLSGAILGWFGSSLLVAAADASQGQTWQWLSRVIGLAAGAVILAAYKPPRMVRKRGIRSIDDEAPADAAVAGGPA